MRLPDDASQVWVASEPDIKTGLRMMVEQRGCCREVAGSGRIQWTAGKTYYVKAYVKEGGGGE